MLTLWVVLAFPFIVGGGYAILFALLRRNADALAGPLGFFYYLILLTIPTGFVLYFHLADVASAIAMRTTTVLWLVPGALVGLALWQLQQRGLPGRTPESL
jgi:hypothetical protein